MLIAPLFIIALVRGLLFNAPQLPDHLIGQDVTVTGVISSIPHSEARVSQFQLTVSEGELNGQTLKLTWYRTAGKRGTKHRVLSSRIPTLAPGQIWRMPVRLKPIHGYRNPGSFDETQWARQHGIIAKGYVRATARQRPQLIAAHSQQQRLLQCRDQLRQRIPVGPMQDILQALTLGFGQQLTEPHRSVLQNTGTAHLMAISGLHIGLVAGVVFMLVGWLTRVCPPLLKRVPKQRIAAIAALIAALIYSALAGFSLSTQRALIMITVVMLGHFWGRVSLLWSLCFALALILALDPLAVGSASLWLSFGAVFLLIYAMGARPLNDSWWWKWGRAQWVCSLGLLPLTVWYFHNISLASFVANLIAIPVVSFVVVPLALLGLALPWLFVPASGVLQALFGVLGVLDAHVSVWLSSSWQLVCALMAVALLYAPKGLRIRQLAVVILLPVLFPTALSLPDGRFSLTVLDVGQGLACVVRTSQHVLIYDTGPNMGAFDAGRQIVVPFCAHERLHSIDVVVVSHGDNDHIGGLSSILQALPVKALYGSDRHKMPKCTVLCDQHIAWDWDGVHFAFLNDQHRVFRNSNDNSCVLRVSGARGSLLLTGDIEKRAEQSILAHQDRQRLQSQVIVVPHHGSKTSSSEAFIAAVRPQTAVFSFGYLNRFHHPSDQVVARYQAVGATILATVNKGAVQMRL